MTYEKIKKNYDKGFWSKAMVHMAVDKGIISQEEYEAIISGGEKPIDEQALVDMIIAEVNK